MSVNEMQQFSVLYFLSLEVCTCQRGFQLACHDGSNLQGHILAHELLEVSATCPPLRLNLDCAFHTPIKPAGTARLQAITVLDVGERNNPPKTACSRKGVGSSI